MKYCRALTTFFAGSRLCDFCKKAVKVVRRHLWSKCSHLVADRLTPLDLQVWQDISNWYCSVILLYTFPIILFLHRPHVPTYCSYCVALAPKVSSFSKKGNLGEHVLTTACPVIFTYAARKQFKKLSKCWKDDEQWNM